MAGAVRKHIDMCFLTALLFGHNIMLVVLLRRINTSNQVNSRSAVMAFFIGCFARTIPGGEKFFAYLFTKLGK